MGFGTGREGDNPYFLHIKGKESSGFERKGDPFRRRIQGEWGREQPHQRSFQARSKDVFPRGQSLEMP